MGDVPIISVDPDRTMQVLRNLVNNAIKSSPEGNEVVIDVVQKGNYINFSVKDSGIGISLKDQEKIFEPFYQAEQTMYREHGGTGLGLAICRGIVESQNGRIWIESKKGKGTKFYFTIPLRPVKKIRPIKLLFSQKENVEKEIKVLFREFLGPIGEEEYMDLEKQKGLTEKNVIGYAKYLNKKGIIKNNIFEEFKKRISHVYKMANGGIKK